MKFDKDGKPIIETPPAADVTVTDNTVSNVIDEKKISDLIEAKIKAALDNYVKTATPVKNEPPVNTQTQTQTTQTDDFDTKYTNKMTEYEKKLDEKYEKKSFLQNLSQQQIDYLKDIDDYEKLSLNQLKKILSKISLPNVETETPEAAGEDLDTIMGKLRPKPVKQ